MVETLSELLENAFRHVTSIVIWLVVCLVGLGGCKSNLVKETCTDRPVWTTVVAKDCYTETVNQQTHTVYELTLIADGRDNQFKLRVDKPTYDRAFINNKSNRLSFNLNRCGLKEAKDFVDTYCDYVL